VRRYAIRFTEEAKTDIERLYEFLLAKDVRAAEHALAALRRGFALLAYSPYSCRKADPEFPRLREIVIPFGSAGYVALLEIEPPATVTVLAVRSQREDDYH
jgi:plasmid stabilization system protein ParE